MFAWIVVFIVLFSGHTDLAVALAVILFLLEIIL